MVVAGDIQTITIEIINNLDDPTMTVIRMIDMKMIITIIIEIIIIIHNVEVTVIIVMIIRVGMVMIVDSEIMLVPEEVVAVEVEVMIIDHLIIVMIIMTIGAHPHLHFTMIEGSTMTINPQPKRLETTPGGDLLNVVPRLIFQIVALLRIINVIVVVVDTREVLTTMLVIMSIALLVVAEALREREEDTMIGKAVIGMGLAAVEEERIPIVVGRMAGRDRDHLPWHLTIKIIGLKTR
mmetsp:Transcript_37144/g.75770  ORF Transcript_37144/g.75770 Transcript_37144/m.75770 type:complete len:237 (-) Transcript_37144:2552-3262(-)